MDSDKEIIQKAIKAAYGCASSWVESTTVEETYKGKIAWSGTVEKFALKACRLADFCYGWTYLDDHKEKEVVTILEHPPVADAHSAVKVYIASQS